MFSALKRLTSSKSEVNGTQATPPGLHAMSVSLQKKFSKGVQYNMKIILRGDRNSGKSCLFRRLQGLPFVEEYTPTEEIQAANIQWNYKTADDVVKVEVWDVVDVAKKKPKGLPNKLKIENNHAKNDQDDDRDCQDVKGDYCLDATFLDVYMNTSGVIFVFDITKNWTFDYVKREVTTVPLHIPILILGNHRDMGHHRAIASDTVHYFIEGLNRAEDSAEIRYAESSMRNGFGLKFIHRFFNLPFLQLQRETLLKQLQRNREEHNVTVQELDMYAESDDFNYDLFIEGLSQKRRQVADALGPQKSYSLAEAQAVAHEKAMKEGNIEKTVSMASKPSIILEPVANSKPNVPQKTLQDSASSLASTTTVGASSSSSNSPLNSRSINNHQSQGPVPVSPRLPNNLPLGNENANKTIKSPSLASPGDVDVDNFVPDESNRGIDKSFFVEVSTPSRNNQFNGRNQSSNKDLHFGSSDEEDRKEEPDANPLVASFVEDVVPEMYSSPNFAVVGRSESPGIISTPASAIVNIIPGAPSPSASKFCILSSSDEELSAEKDQDNSTSLNSNFKLNLNLSELPASNLELDLGIFLKDDVAEVASSSLTKHNRHGDDVAKEKKSSKKSSNSSSSSSKHHKKSKHKKSSGSKKDRSQRDLDDFLNGGDDSSHKPDDVDLNAYEAL